MEEFLLVTAKFVLAGIIVMLVLGVISRFKKQKTTTTDENVPPTAYKTEGLDPWLSIWTKPRETIRAIVSTDPNLHFLFITVFLGVLMGFRIVVEESLEGPLSVSARLLIIIGSAVLGPILINVFAYLTRTTGRWLDGAASFKEVRASFAWSCVPGFISSGFAIICLAVFEQEPFSFESLKVDLLFSHSPALGLLFSFILLSYFVAYCWEFAVSLLTLSEMQGFSVWKALLNHILAIICFLVACLCVVVVIGVVVIVGSKISILF